MTVVNTLSGASTKKQLLLTPEDKSTLKNVCENLFNLRINQGLSIDDFIDDLGVSKSYMVTLENPDKGPNLAAGPYAIVIYKIALKYEVPMELLFKPNGVPLLRVPNADLIKGCRTRLGKKFTQKNVGESIAMKPTDISKIETGKIVPPSTTLRLLAKAYGVDIIRFYI